MDKFLLILCFLAAIGMVVLVFPEGVQALVLVLILSAAALFVFRKFTDDKKFITNVFLAALLCRIVFGIMVHVYDLRDFFGGDANTYDFRGSKLLDLWLGNTLPNDSEALAAASMFGSGWGMNYLVASLYLIFGKNIFLAQSFCAVHGAATAPLVYFCANKIFQNIRVAKFSAVAIALFPSFIIWSAQLMKDGLIIFLLVLAITMVMQLQDRFHFTAILFLVFSVLGIMSLRFYIFYMIAIAVVGSFLIGTSNTIESMARRTITLILLGLALTYFGVMRTGGIDLGRFGSFEAVQRSRLDLATSAKSGFGEDVDISTTEGAISVIPIGLLYLMFAPFPWQAGSSRQGITIPEVLLWYAMIPFLLSGIWYTMRHRLRSAFPILIFSLMLTLAYSVFQGNVGTAYRQRTQIQVFLFMFIGVGWVLFKEKREDRALEQRIRRERLEASLQARFN